MAEKQLVVAVEGTAAMGPFWQTIVFDYLDKIIRCFCNNEMTGQKPSVQNTELSLVMFNAHGSYSACLVQRSGWTREVDTFLQWLSAIPFVGGGFNDAAIAEGLAEALMMLSHDPSGNQTQQNLDGHRHCILVAANNPHPLPTPVYRPRVQNLEQNENVAQQMESNLSDAEAVAQSFSKCSVSLSVICPKQLPRLRAIYNVGKHNVQAADPPIDNAKNPQFLVLISDSFMEACAALAPPGVASLACNQSPMKLDTAPAPPFSGPTPASVPSVNGSVMTRQSISVGNIPTTTVKVEPSAVSCLVSGAAFPQVSSVPRAASQGVPSLQASSPSSASQDIVSNSENTQELKSAVNSLPQSIRAVNTSAANVSILNKFSQARQVLTGGTSIGLQSMGGTHMAMHMSNMISSGTACSLPSNQNLFSSGQSSTISSTSGLGLLAGTAQLPQNSALGSFTSTTSNMPANSIISISQPMSNPQVGASMGQSAPGMSQGSLSGTQMVQSGINMNQNMGSALGPSNMSIGTGTMMPTPGLAQVVQTGMQPVGANNNSTMNMPLSQQTSSVLQSAQSKYVRVWEGNLSGQRQGQPVFITRLEGYKSAAASESLAENWPATMQIVRLISQDHMNNKQYVGKADFLVFRAMNQHGFLSQLQEKKLCAVIQLPAQTLLLSVSDKACRLIGMLFPGDMVVFKPQISSQQLQQQLQQQQLSQFQQQQQQMGQAYVQGQGRPQVSSQGPPPNIHGGGFLS